MPVLNLRTLSTVRSSNNGAPAEVVRPTTRLLPSWLRAYGEYTSDNEAPESYHLWVGLAIIAGAAQRKISMVEKHRRINSNLYVILTGPSGKTRKTTALLIGEGFLSSVPGIHIGPRASSMPALISKMAEIGKTNPEHQSVTVVSHELGTLLTNNPAEAVDILTDLFDGNANWSKDTIVRGPEKLTAPWLNIIAGTTPQWMGENFSKTFVEGGFASRCIFVHETEKSKLVASQEDTPESQALRKKLINDLIHISKLKGEMRFTPEGFEFYKKWYENPKGRFPMVEDPRTAGYYERKHVHLQRIAMLLSLAERDDLTVSERDLRAALMLLGMIEPGMKKAFSAVGRNEYATDLERILSQIEQAGPDGVSYKTLVATNYAALGKENLDRILEQLDAMGAATFHRSMWKVIKQDA